MTAAHLPADPRRPAVHDPAFAVYRKVFDIRNEIEARARGLQAAAIPAHGDA